MNFRKTAASLLAAVLLCSCAGSIEAAGFSASETWGPITVDEKVGEGADNLSIKTPTAIKLGMLNQCADEYVKPYFQNKGSYLSDDEAKAVAFGALQMSDLSESNSGDKITFTAAYAAEHDYILDLVYGNKKYLQAFIDNFAEYSQLSREKTVAVKAYLQYGSEADTVLGYNRQLEALIIKFNYMSKYWAPGYGFTVTGTDVNFRAEPSTDSAVLDVLDKEEMLAPAGEKIEANGRSWYPAYNAKGDFGYVCADYIRATS